MTELHPKIQREVDTIEHEELRVCVARYLAENRRPAIRVDELMSQRNYLETSWFEWLIGRRARPPQLDRMASKYGGLPYLESADEWPTRDGHRAEFVGQLNFDETDGPEGFPDEGMLSVYTPGSGEEMFETRWYAEPSPERAASISWPAPSVKIECPLRLSPAESYRTPGFWQDVVPGELEDLDEIDGLLRVDEAVWEVTGNVGALPFFGLDGPGPRDWLEESFYDIDDWLVLWTPLEGWWGSMSYSLMIRPDDFARRRFDRAHTMCWQ